MNKNRRNKVYSVIKQLKVREYSKDTYFSLNYYIPVIFVSTFPQNLTSCILNVVDRCDVKTLRQRDSNIPALTIEQLHWQSRTGYEEIFP